MNLDHLRAFFVVLEEGSLNKAAARLHLSQSTVTRQMRALEHAVGGRLLERTAAGVVPTAAGQELAEAMRPVLERFDTVMRDVRAFAAGRRGTLRIGYVASASAAFLHPALAELRRAHPAVKVSLLNLSPGEQAAALRKGDLDVALIGHAGAFLSHEFYTRRLAAVGVLAVLPDGHPLAREAKVPLSALREASFIGAADADMPGHNRWIERLCRRAGFRPQFILDGESLAHALASVVTEDAVMLVPDYLADSPVPGVAFRPLDEPDTRWDIYVAWQRGSAAAPVVTLVDALARYGGDTPAPSRSTVPNP